MVGANEQMANPQRGSFACPVVETQLYFGQASCDSSWVRYPNTALRPDGHGCVDCERVAVSRRPSLRPPTRAL